MTSAPVLPPQLYLPTTHVDTAIDLLDEAIASLQLAQQVEWESIAAEAFQLHLYKAIQQVRALKTKVEGARDYYLSARFTAQVHGQC